MRTGRPCARRLAARLGATTDELQSLAVALALAAPFLSPRDLDRWRARLVTWQRTTHDQGALLDRLERTLARYTADAGDAARPVRSA